MNPTQPGYEPRARGRAEPDSIGQFAGTSARGPNRTGGVVDAVIKVDLVVKIDALHQQNPQSKVAERDHRRRSRETPQPLK